MRPLADLTEAELAEEMHATVASLQDRPPKLDFEGRPMFDIRLRHLEELQRQRKRLQ